MDKQLPYEKRRAREREKVNKIYIKAWFGDWKEVDAEKAKTFVTGLKKGMMCSDEKKAELINKSHLKGITYEELMKGE